jgi:hypothetical protein
MAALASGHESLALGARISSHAAAPQVWQSRLRLRRLGARKHRRIEGSRMARAVHMRLPMIRTACLLPVLAIGLVPAFATMGCADEAGSHAATASPASPNDDAIARITAARCEREVACNNVGDGRKYADKASCEREVKQDTSSSLRASECGAVVSAEVDNCLSEVVGQKCGDPFDAVSRLAACRQGKVCTK